jgi:hypothetical protein
MNIQTLAIIVIAALTGSAATLLTELFTDTRMKLATVDPGVLVAEHLRGLERGLDENTIRLQSQTYARNLEQAVDAVAKEYKVTLLVKPGVITGAPDLTDEVRRRIHAQQN